MRPDAVIVGGGLAGAAAACRLAVAGRAVLLLEREAGAHHKVCGEFISGEAARDLARLGLDLPALGAEPIEAVRMIAGTVVAESRLPFKAFGLSRHRLDAALLSRAEALGSTVRRGITVRAIEPATGGSTQVLLEGENSVRAPAVLLATGKHDLRGWARPGPRESHVYIGFKMHFRLAAPAARALRGAVEIHLFAGGYAGLQLVEAGEANLCLLVAPGLHASLGRSWDGLIHGLGERSPVLASRLANAEALWPRPLAIARVPYGFVQSRAMGADPLWRLGDQAAVTPSFTGDGMAIALHTARLATATLLLGGHPGDYRRALSSGVARQVGRSMLLSRALSWSPAQRPMVAALRAAPALLRAGAVLTRLPEPDGP